MCVCVRCATALPTHARTRDATLARQETWLSELDENVKVIDQRFNRGMRRIGCKGKVCVLGAAAGTGDPRARDPAAACVGRGWLR